MLNVMAALGERLSARRGSVKDAAQATPARPPDGSKQGPFAPVPPAPPAPMMRN